MDNRKRKIDNWKRKIEYAEYDSGVILTTEDIREEHDINAGKLDISFLSLALSTAKCLTTRTHNFTPETVLLAKSYIDAIPFLVGERNGYLALNKESEKIVRDFSKTTRHGELAQGINYIIAKKVLGAIAVYDFDYYVREEEGITQKYRGRKPDFVLVYRDGRIGILESKGTIAADPSPFMWSGHGQCEDGRNFLLNNAVAVRNAYVSAVSFATTSLNMKRNTKVYYLDPPGIDDNSQRDITKDRMYEYSKFFFLAGNSRAYEKLKKGERLDRQDIYSEIDNNIDGIIAKWSIDNTQKIALGIVPELEQFLCNETDSYPEEKLREKARQSSEIEVLEDGTFIKLITGDDTECKKEMKEETTTQIQEILSEESKYNLDES